MFSLNVHHDGMFLFNPLRYEHGQELLVETMHLSVGELTRYIEAQIGNVIEGLYYLLRTNDFNSIMKLRNDRDVEVFFDIADSYGTVQVYCEHLGVPLDNYIQNDKEQPEEIDVDEHREEVLYDTEDHDNENKVFGEETETNDSGDDVSTHEENNQEEECIRTTEVGDSSRQVGDEDSDDEDYLEEDEDSDADSVASLDHLSEGEDEVREVRQGRSIARVPTTRQLPKVGGDQKDLGKEKSVLQEEHDQFLNDLVEAMTNNNNGDEVVDPLQPPPEEVPTFPVHDKATHWRFKIPKVNKKPFIYKFCSD